MSYVEVYFDGGIALKGANQGKMQELRQYFAQTTRLSM